LFQILIRERFELEDAQTRKKGFVERKGRILCGCSNQDNRAVFEEGEEDILLGFIETMDFINEKDDLATEEGIFAGVFDDFFQISDAMQKGAERKEMGIEGLGVEPSERCFTAAGRAPKQ